MTQEEERWVAILGKSWGSEEADRLFKKKKN